MKRSELVLAVLTTPAPLHESDTAERFRGLTISWCRYGYQGVVLEGHGVDDVLQQAVDMSARYCFILPSGVILYERWRLEDGQPRDFFAALDAWIESHEFLVAGTLLSSQDSDSATALTDSLATSGWYGLASNACLLVNLSAFKRLGRPSFSVGDATQQATIDVPQAVATYVAGTLERLQPTAASEVATPRSAGWRLIDSSLRAGLPIERMSELLSQHTLDLGATQSAQREALVPFLGAGIHDYNAQCGADGLTSDQCRFLNVIKTQAENARRGVFLWNIESYEDIEAPSDGFLGPVASLYSVAAGFKPNRILETHGFDANSRVVFFDYSQRALDVRKFLLAEWDGLNLPSFVRQVFARFPRPETFYQLWNELTPDDDIEDDMQRMWQRELTAWGGAAAFSEHWRRYRELEHEFICCNILTGPQPVLETLRCDANSDSIIWWSNAFFTMYGNWFYSLEQRQQAYATWARELAARDERLFLLGSDHNNTCVNSVRAADYWQQYQVAQTGCLRPFKMHRKEIRM